MASKATIEIQSIRAALGTEVALGKMTKEERKRIEDLLGLSWREQQFDKKEEENFIKELEQFFERWDLMLHAEISPNTRVEYIVGEFRNKSFFHPKGVGYINAKDVKLLPRIAKRRDMFEKIPLNESVHIDDVRPILAAITRVETGSMFYVTDEEYKQMIEDLKAKYHLS